MIDMRLVDRAFLLEMSRLMKEAADSGQTVKIKPDVAKLIAERLSEIAYPRVYTGSSA